MSFKDLGLRNELLKIVEEEGYTTPTPIQKLAIPLVLEGFDLMAGAQTGTGKTAGFTLPLLHKLMSSRKNQNKVRALILTPTRELAAQVADNVKTYGKYSLLKSKVIFGGVSINSQIHALRKGVDILIATPGRLLDLISQRAVDLSHLEMLVLDEADRMLDMGFIPDIRKILSLVPQSRQSLLFSATFSPAIKNLAASFLKSPKIIEAAQNNSPAELVSQVVHPVDNKRKKELLSFLISSQNWKQVLVFVRTKHSSNRLAEQLSKEGIPATAINGNKSQAARTRALEDFKRGIFQVLVGTDVAARGLDIDLLPHVINFDLPTVPEDYVHRIGRTGRAGNKGEAISLVSIDEQRLLRDIERLLNKKIPSIVVPGYEPNPSIKREPIQNRRNNRRSSFRNRGPQRQR